MGGAARCEGRCNALRWHMQRAVFFTPPLCLVCDMPPFSPSQSFSTLLSALFLSLFNFFSFFHQFLFFLSPAFSKKKCCAMYLTAQHSSFYVSDRWGWSCFVMYEGADGFPFARR